MKNRPPDRQVFLQDRTSKLFVVETDQWTSDVQKAHDFANTRDAIVFALSHRLRDVHLMIHFESHALRDVFVPVSTEK